MVWRFGIGPERAEIGDHGSEPLADGLIEDDLVVLPGALAFFTGAGQDAQLVVPFAFERVGDEAILGIDEHEAALRKIVFDLGALDRAAAQFIGFFLPGLDLLAHFKGQLDGGWVDLLSDQSPVGFVDGRSGDRLTKIGAAIIVGAIAGIPCLPPASAACVANREVSAASPAYGFALQKRRTLSRDRGTSRVISLAVRFEELEVLLVAEDDLLLRPVKATPSLDSPLQRAADIAVEIGMAPTSS